ncbi:hypothetical protein BDZ91DRAFT_710476 [Kalaharituber pfeilii]|nr:hypothetical protein BDZ91DRAFT_710476 [Kalaharituber pfeilii]
MTVEETKVKGKKEEKEKEKEKADKKEKKVKKMKGERKELQGTEEEGPKKINGDNMDVDTVVMEENERKSKKEKKVKVQKERKDRKEKQTEKDEEAGKGDNGDATSTPQPSSSRKRKRSSTLPEGEIAIDISAPEPPSKKALRKLKRAAAAIGEDPAAVTSAPITSTEPQSHGIGATQNRSKYGVWIGNLSYTTTEDDLREFFSKPGMPAACGDADVNVGEGTVPPPPGLQITRINLPTKKAYNDATRKEEVKNRGFAYVDLNVPEGVKWAVKYKSDNYLGPRKVLIKDAKSFEGRPERSTSGVEGDGQKANGMGNPSRAATPKNPPSKILFVGNLPFETTDEEIAAHFTFAGEPVRVRLARFEDSGKCKGFGFLDFPSTEQVQRAMKGVSAEEEAGMAAGEDELEGKEEVKRSKERKKRRAERRFFKDRLLRLEFGEDPETRYKKRFGGKGNGEERNGEEEQERREQKKSKLEKKGKKDTEIYGKNKDRAMVSRMTGTIVQATGKKVTFD